VKILLDTCVWGGARIPLTEAAHDVVWAGDWSEDPGDEAILARAGVEGRVLVTLDKDFGELAVVRGGTTRGHRSNRWPRCARPSGRLPSSLGVTRSFARSRSNRDRRAGTHSRSASGRGLTFRIISARRATRHEQKNYKDE
jgi:hypothetical protein